MATSCTSGPGEIGPRIPEADPENWAGISIPEWTAGTPYPFVGAFNLCLDWPGTVEITDVKMEQTEGGLRIDAYGFRPRTPLGPQPETYTETLAELGYKEEWTTISALCEEELGGPSNEALAREGLGPIGRSVDEFAIQFSKPTSATARGAIIRLTYRSANQVQVHRLGFELVLCEHSDSHPECSFKEYDWP